MGNRLVNSTTVKQGLYDESLTANGDLGSVMEWEDGRKFIYSKAAEELTIGTVCQGPIENGSNHDESLTIPTDKDIAVGDTTVTVTTQRIWTANLFKDGYLIVEDVNYIGHVRKIKYHPYAAAAASCVLTVYDAFTAIATAGSELITVVQNPYQGVLKNEATTSGPLLGVPPITVTDKYYFWLQVAGPAGVKTNEASLAVGALVVVDGQAGLAILQDDAADAEVIGRVMQTCATSGNAAIIWLNFR